MSSEQQVTNGKYCTFVEDQSLARFYYQNLRMRDYKIYNYKQFVRLRMRPKNISFGEAIRSKQQRSPQLELKNKAMKLADLVRQWENDPENNYTLYLGQNQYSQRSQFSTSRMLTSSNRNNPTHFDSWIQNQRSPFTVQMDNSQGYRVSKGSQGSRKVNINSKTQQSSKSPKTMGELVRKNKQVYHVENSSQFANSVGNVQMIKSKTCETNQKKNMPFKQQQQYRREAVTDHIQLEQPPMKKEAKQCKSQFITNRTYQMNEGKKEMKFRSLLQNKKKEESIEQLVDNTKKNITNQIAELAIKYAQNDDEIEAEQNFQQISSRVQEPEQQQQDELLIGDSDKKPLGSEKPIFSQAYQETARKAQEMDRLRKEQAKNRINDLMKNYKPLKKNDEIFKMPEMNFDKFQQKQQVFQDNYHVGYSFASNQPQQLKKYENFSRQDNICQNNQQHESEKPMKLESSEQFQFKQKYVNFETNQVPSFQNVFSRQSLRQEQGKVNQKQPNNSFLTKFITTTKQEQAKMASVQIPTNSFSRHQFSRKNSAEQFTKIEVISKELKNFSQAQATQVKVETEKIQNKSFSQQFGKFPHQKIKIVSSGRNYNNSNKSHKSGSDKSSNEKNPVLQMIKEVKTEPFAPILETPQNQKPKEGLEAKEISSSRQRCSPFKTIKQVKNSIVNPSKSSEEVSVANVISHFEEKTNNFQRNTEETSQEERVKPIELQFKTQESKSSYLQPSYAKTKTSSNFQTSPYYTNQYIRNTPLSYALPTHIQESNTHSFKMKALNRSKQISNQYQLPTYAQKKYSSPKTFDYAPKYESKYSSSISSSYQVCEKFDSILNLTKKQFPQNNKQNITRIVEPTYATPHQITTKRSFLTELDIKQSINMQDVGKKQLVFSKMQQTLTKKVQPPFKEISSGLDNVIKKSLKQSINLQSSDQFKFDF